MTIMGSYEATTKITENIVSLGKGSIDWVMNMMNLRAATS